MGRDSYIAIKMQRLVSILGREIGTCPVTRISEARLRMGLNEGCL